MFCDRHGMETLAKSLFKQTTNMRCEPNGFKRSGIQKLMGQRIGTFLQTKFVHFTCIISLKVSNQ